MATLQRPKRLHQALLLVALASFMAMLAVLALLTAFSLTRGAFLGRQPIHALGCSNNMVPGSDVFVKGCRGGSASNGEAAVAAEAAAVAAEAAAASAQLPIEVWARQPSGGAALPSNPLRSLLSPAELTNLTQLCGRCLYHSLQNVMHARSNGHWTFVATGDIGLMWIRDSAIQLGVLLPRMARRPALRQLVEGGIRMQAFYITQDPYANGYQPHWSHPEAQSKGERILGRGAFVGVRNYELDSGAYYLNLLWNYWGTEGLHRPEALLGEPLTFEAANLMVDTWITEQRHEELSPYRYSELPRDGLGSQTGYTGMSWSGYRPSDDPAEFGYAIPANMYAAGALERALALNKAVWRSEAFKAKASKLLAGIQQGIQKYGLVTPPGSTSSSETVYAYEVDGLGGSLLDFDDPNIPSLVALPLLGYSGFDREAYQRTKARVLSAEHNRYYFKGKYLDGLGSPHTPHGMVWALGIFSEAMTADSPAEQVSALRRLLIMQCQDGLMHESIDVDNLGRCTRVWFEWANALLVTAVEQLLGVDCNEAAEAFHRATIKEREEGDVSVFPANGGADNARYYETIEAAVQYEGMFEVKVPADLVTSAASGAEGAGVSLR